VVKNTPSSLGMSTPILMERFVLSPRARSLRR
jgi:hypothetical protein